jgi:cAMP phosphodiesterase
MNKTLKINQNTIDKTTKVVYNTIMTNDNNNTKNQFLKGTNNMTMKISSLEFTTEMLNDVWKGHSVEMPKTDALRIVSNPKAAADFIAEFGDVEIVLNTEYAPRWKVAAFAESRGEYGKLKQAYCDQYGSN